MMGSSSVPARNNCDIYMSNAMAQFLNLCRHHTRKPGTNIITLKYYRLEILIQYGELSTVVQIGMDGEQCIHAVYCDINQVHQLLYWSKSKKEDSIIGLHELLGRVDNVLTNIDWLDIEYNCPTIFDAR